MTQRDLTLVIATFNSEKMLPPVFEALRKQTFPREKYTVLLVDGGSSDKTKEVGEAFGCEFINNPRTEPIYAKYLALKTSKTRIIMYLDHDEIIQDENALSDCVKTIKENPETWATVSSGYMSPKGLAWSNNYINEFGDPFSCFIYGMSRDFRYFQNNMKSRYNIESETDTATFFNFGEEDQLPLVELCAAGCAFDREYAIKHSPALLEKPELIPHVFYLTKNENPRFAVLKRMPIEHRSAETMKKFKSKIRWRIINNVFFADSVGSGGFSGRESNSAGIASFKKFLFLPYAFSIVLPILHSLYFMITRRDARYIGHAYLTYFTAITIAWCMIQKLMGVKKQLTSYDGKKVVQQKVSP